MRGYRAALWAYPKGPRREELLDTLTAGGRTWPTPREVGNLFRHGMRARLGRPSSRGVVVLAVLVALSTAFLSAAVASRLAWETAPDFPVGAKLAAIQETLFPGTPHWAARNGDGVVDDTLRPSTGQLLLWGHDEDFGMATLTIGPEGRAIAGDYRAWTEAAAARLAREGWDVGTTAPTGPTDIASGRLLQEGTAVEATRDGITMTVETSTAVVGTPPGSFDVTATLLRLPHGHVAALTWTGWLIGALAGWLVTGWASRRTEEAGPVAGFLTRGPVVIALFLWTPLTVIGTLGLLLETFGDSASDKPFWSLSATWGYGVTQLGVLLCLMSVVVAAVDGRRRGQQAAASAGSASSVR